MSIQLSNYNHDSWGMCITSTECKTIIIAVLMIMSGMDSHMISGNLGWVLVKSLVGLCRSGIYLGCGLVTVRLRDAIEVVTFKEMSLLPCLLD
jgi:hypothetical protein